MKKNLKKHFKKLLAVLLLALLAAGMAFVYVRFGAKPVAGSKAITIPSSIRRIRRRFTTFAPTRSSSSARWRKLRGSPSPAAKARMA